jgi:hypothetical protein
MHLDNDMHVGLLPTRLQLCPQPPAIIS